MVLNFGHTTGHAIEACAGYGKFSHGQAIGVGILVAAELSDIICRLAAGSKGRLKNAVKSLLDKTNTSAIGGDELWNAIQFDKKKDLGEVRFTLLKNLGKPQMKTVMKDQFLAAYDTVCKEPSR
jgi:3-dehydroquinate synthase